MSMHPKSSTFSDAISSLSRLSEKLSGELNPEASPQAAAAKILLDIAHTLVADLVEPETHRPRGDMIALMCSGLASVTWIWSEDPSCAHKAMSLENASLALSDAVVMTPEVVGEEDEDGPTDEDFLVYVESVTDEDDGLFLELLRRMMKEASSNEEDHLRSVVLWLGEAALNPGSDMEMEIRHAVAVGLLRPVLSDELLEAVRAEVDAGDAYGDPDVDPIPMN